MENPRPEKVAVVDDVRRRFAEADGAVLTEYRGLSVTEIATLRRALTEAGGEYKVYKNTLVRFAARDLDLGIEDLLTGPNAIAFVHGDAAAVAKALRDFAQTNDKLVIKGGLLGTKRLEAAEINALAQLPSRDVLLARLAGGLAAPMQKMAGLLQALPRNFAYGLKALIDQGGTGVADAPAESPATETSDDAPVGVAEATAPEAEAEAPAEAPEAVETAEVEAATDSESDSESTDTTEAADAASEEES